VRVWLPPVPPRAVLYLNDGQNLFADPRSRRPNWGADEITERLIAAGEILPVAIVGIDHGGRRRSAEYLPYADPHNARPKRFEADRYADLVVGCVMPAIARLHPAIARVGHVGVGGSSYGAIAALHTAIRHRGVFDRLLVESAPLWVGDGRLIEEARDALGRGWMWIGVGTSESGRAERSADLVALARQLARAMRERHEVRLRVVRGAPHHESVWAERLPAALRWLFPGPQRGRLPH